jgi:hypothetical protein
MHPSHVAKRTAVAGIRIREAVASLREWGAQQGVELPDPTRRERSGKRGGPEVVVLFEREATAEFLEALVAVATTGGLARPKAKKAAAAS